MSEREALLRKIQICDFALIEINLFLDTHPDDQYAMASFKEYLALSREFKNEYNMRYGPLTAADFDCDRTWSWVENPWPWQNCCECAYEED